MLNFLRLKRNNSSVLTKRNLLNINQKFKTKHLKRIINVETLMYKT